MAKLPKYPSREEVQSWIDNTPKPENTMPDMKQYKEDLGQENAGGTFARRSAEEVRNGVSRLLRVQFPDKPSSSS